jgi:hypothetical protein
MVTNLLLKIILKNNFSKRSLFLLIIVIYFQIETNQNISIIMINKVFNLFLKMYLSFIT